jgi:copper transport protein
MTLAQGLPARRVALALVVAVAALTGLARSTPAEAHAVLVRSSPAAQAQLVAAPSSLDLWFSEPLEGGFSTFSVLDGTGQPVLIDGIEVDAGDPKHLVGFPRALEPGIYTVVYRTLSQADGHEWSGSFSFTVLNEDGSVPAGSAFEADAGATSSGAGIAGRWLGFVGFSLLVGAAWLVFIAHRTSASPEAASPVASEVYRGLVLASLPLLVGSLALLLLDQVAKLDSDVSTVVFDTRFGQFWTFRALLVWAAVTALVIGSLATRSNARRVVELEFAPAVLGALGLLTVPFIAHAAAAPGSGWAIAADYLHLLLAAAWLGALGGLAAFLARVRGRPASERAEVARRYVMPFSGVAAAAVFLLTVTGIMRSFGELPTLSALTSTDYGRALLVKLALVAVTLLFALRNRTQLRALEAPAPPKRGAAPDVARVLERGVLVEVALGLAILASVAVLSQLPTPRGTATPAAVTTIAPFNGIVVANDVNVHLQVAPPAVGNNSVKVHVYHEDGSPLGGIERVRLTFGLGADPGGQQVDATPIGDNVFEASGNFLTVAAEWSVRIDVQRAGLDDARATYRVQVAPGVAEGSRGAWASPAPQLTTNALVAFVLLVAGTGALLRVGTRRRASTRRALAAMLVGAGVWVGISGETHRETPGLFPTNPVEATSASIARGAALYGVNCASCHGETGSGDGPLAADLTPRPADFFVHVPLHSDGEIFVFISKGFPGTGMAGWEDVLSAEERWDLVNYLRTLTEERTR